MVVLGWVGCLLLVLPFGWMLGLVAAIVLSGGAVGQLPMLTIPIAVLGSLAFAVLPLAPVATRLRVMAAGTALLYLLAFAFLGLAGHL